MRVVRRAVPRPSATVSLQIGQRLSRRSAAGLLTTAARLFGKVYDDLAKGATGGEFNEGVAIGSS